MRDPELEQLLKLVTPSDTLRGMFVNGVLEIAREQGGEAVHQKCLAAVKEPRYVDFSRYPMSEFLPLVYTAAELLGSKLGGKEAALQQFGRRAAADFLQSTLGRTILALAGREPQRMLTAVPRAYQAAVNHGERDMQWPAPNQARMVTKRCLLPCRYEEGILLGVLSQSIARGVSVRGRRTTTQDAEYDIRWE